MWLDNLEYAHAHNEQQKSYWVSASTRASTAWQRDGCLGRNNCRHGAATVTCKSLRAWDPGRARAVCFG